MSIRNEDLTFGQAMGLEPLPRQLNLTEVSPELTSHLWAVIYLSMTSGRYSEWPWRKVMASWWIEQAHRPADEYSGENWKLQQIIKEIVYCGNYLRLYNFLQYVIRHESAPTDIARKIAGVLENCRAAVRVVDKTIVPISSEENAEAVAGAFEIASKHSAAGPRAHLRNASTALTRGDWAGAIRESIHAVEASAKVIEPEADTLGPALTALERRGIIGGAQKRGFNALYGYSSDTDGVRHALAFENEATVDERDAMYMFGACAAFVGFLLSTDAAAAAGNASPA